MKKNANILRPTAVNIFSTPQMMRSSFPFTNEKSNDKNATIKIFHVNRGILEMR